jgi:hypothetical protein
MKNLKKKYLITQTDMTKKKKKSHLHLLHKKKKKL